MNSVAAASSAQLAAVPDGARAPLESLRGVDAPALQLERSPARMSAAAGAATLVLDAIALVAVQVAFFDAGVAGLVGTALALAMFAAGGSYRFRPSPAVWPEAPGLAGRVAVAVVAAGLVAGPERVASIVWAAPWALVAVLAARAISYAALRKLRTLPSGGRPVVVIGAGRLGVQAAVAMRDHPVYGLRPIGIVDDVADADIELPFLGRLQDLPGIVRATGATGVVAAFGVARDEAMLRVLRACEELDVRVWVVPRLFELGAGDDGPRAADVRGFPLVELDGYRRALRTRRAKRLIDLALAVPALVVAAPVMAAIAVAVRVSSPGPALFRQTRIGRRGAVVELMKFRSMRMNDDSDTTWSTAGDNRVTRIGRVLRATSLDELPQLWNVLRGDMSLVGPRPERPVFVDKFSVVVPGYADRHRLAPGLTGLAQVNGLRGDTSIEERARFDNRYIDRWSLWQDVTIMARTVPAVLRDAIQAIRR